MTRAAALLAALAVVAAGCGVGAGSPPGGVTLTVTDGFGSRTLVDTDQPEADGEETIMRLLQRNADVKTRYGGGFVQSIEGLGGGQEDGRPVDWFYYVNGIEAPRGSADTEVEDGDHVWWDRHDWGTAMRVPAVIGAYPEPFVHGVDGERLPVRLECDDPGGEACDAVNDALIDLDLIPGKAQLGTAQEAEVLRVLVGRWRAVTVNLGVAQIEEGPRASGVFARMNEEGDTLEALDPQGRVARRLGAGTGLVAATKVAGEQPTWVVTGTDDAGVAAAARAFAQGEAALSGKFALAVADDVGLALPVVAR
jgi:Domain of unknown function (DUF4430)